MSKKKNLEKELAALGIKTEAQLKEAIAKLPPLNLYIMTAPAAGKAVYGMKIKKFRAYRPEIQVEFKKPILGRLYFLANWPNFVKLASCQLQIATPDGPKPLKKIYILIWPKFEFSAAGKEQ